MLRSRGKPKPNLELKDEVARTPTRGGTAPQNLRVSRFISRITHASILMCFIVASRWLALRAGNLTTTCSLYTRDDAVSGTSVALLYISRGQLVVFFFFHGASGTQRV